MPTRIAGKATLHRRSKSPTFHCKRRTFFAFEPSRSAFKVGESGGASAVAVDGRSLFVGSEKGDL